MRQPGQCHKNGGRRKLSRFLHPTGRLLIIGFGNPILADDGIGLKVVRELGRIKPHLKVIEVTESGIGLLDLITGYDRLIIVDSIITGRQAPGSVYRLYLDQLHTASGISSSHGAGIASVINIGRAYNYEMPATVTVYAIEITDNTTFQEGLTSGVARRLNSIVKEIMRNENI